MHLQLLRYHQTARMARGILSIDGQPFCETREPIDRLASASMLPTGDYQCRCTASSLSPMTLKVCRRRGQSLVFFGWDFFRPCQSGMISLGQADPNEPPEERELTRQQETFDAFTQRVYAAYAQNEEITLTIALHPTLTQAVCQHCLESYAATESQS